MKTFTENREPFCTASAIAVVRQQLCARECSGDKLAFFVLSGAFNPVHTQHVDLLCAAKVQVERRGFTVVGAFLAPSPDDYVKQKLGEGALTLLQRTRLCSLAVEGLDWITVCPAGEVSSKWACHNIRRELEEHCADVLHGRCLTGVGIMGSDAFVRIFTKVLEQNRDSEAKSVHRGRVFCCFLRPGQEAAAERMHIRKTLAPAMFDLGVELTVMRGVRSNQPHKAVSSSGIRELLARGDWETLRSKQWLDPAVLTALKSMTK